MSFDWDVIWKGLVFYGYTNCTADIHDAIMEIDKHLNDTATNPAIKEKFLSPNSSKTRNGDLAAALAISLENWQDEGPYDPIGRFCNWTSTDPLSEETSGKQGFSATKGASYTIDRWASFSGSVASVNEQLKTSCLGYQTTKSSSTTTVASYDLIQGLASLNLTESSICGNATLKGGSLRAQISVLAKLSQNTIPFSIKEIYVMSNSLAVYPQAFYTNSLKPTKLTPSTVGGISDPRIPTALLENLIHGIHFPL